MEPLPSESPLMVLYQCCLELALGIVKSPGPTLTSSSSQRLRTQVQKLSLWGSDFDVSGGFLATERFGADRLSNALLSILEELAGTLITLAQQFPSEEKLSEITLRASILKEQASRAVSRPTPHRDDHGVCNFTVDDFSSSGSEGPSDDEVDQVEDLIKDVQFHNDCLYGLGPVLHNPAERVGQRSESMFNNDPVREEITLDRSKIKEMGGKWESPQNVGQEELYMAAEEVLIKLSHIEEYSGLLTQVNGLVRPDYTKGEFRKLALLYSQTQVSSQSSKILWT